MNFELKEQETLKWTANTNNAQYDTVACAAAHLVGKYGLWHRFNASFADVDAIPEALGPSKFKLLSSSLSKAADEAADFIGEFSGGLIRVTFQPWARSCGVQGYFTNSTDCEAIRDLITKLFPKNTIADNLATLTYWSWATDEAEQRTQRITVPKWTEVRANYTGDVRDELDKLVSTKAGTAPGRLILWRGVPGTGKTWALRALCREWKDWCTFNYIVDPDEFFGRASYMSQVISGFRSDANKWNLLVLEDCGELIAKDAKAQTGQALAKLLNLSDGLLGQGVKLLILITTNEEQAGLHEAVGRAGRCLSNLEFRQLTEAEAEVWLEAHSKAKQVPASRTLADLYACAADSRVISNEREQQRVGFLQ